MSTKIFDVYEWVGPKGLEGLLEYLRGLRGPLFEQFLSQVVHGLDPNINLAALPHVGDYARQLREGLRSPFRGPIVTSIGNADIEEVNAVVYLHRRKILVQFFGLPEPLIEALDADKRFVDKHYQNQTDRPPNISAKEYRSRRTMWDDIFQAAGSYVPCDIGLTYKLFTNDMLNKLVDGVYRHLFGRAPKGGTSRAPKGGTK